MGASSTKTQTEQYYEAKDNTSHVEIKQDNAYNDYISTHSQLINMGFDEALSLEAAKKYPKDINKAIICIEKQEKKNTKQSSEAKDNTQNGSPFNIIKTEPSDTTQIPSEPLTTSSNGKLKEMSDNTMPPSSSSSQKLKTEDLELKRQQFITIPIKDRYFNFSPILVSVPYNESIKLLDVFNKVTKKVNETTHPIKYRIRLIHGCSFTEMDGLDDLYSKSITKYTKHDIIDKGLVITFENKFIHKINKLNIDCEYIKKQSDETKDDEKIDPVSIALKCPIYKAMKSENKFTTNNLQHLCEFNHFEDEFMDKPICEYYQNCLSFERLENGGNEISDRCHIKIYKHPPRNSQQIRTKTDIHSFIANIKNHPIYDPPEKERTKYGFNYTDGYLQALIQEVINNGFKYDLCLECTSNDDCTHSENSLLLVVDDKLNHIRHQNINKPLRRDHMLALVLYTSCNCNYDLCSSQRKGDYLKWKWFDYCLWNAIETLSKREHGSYKLYTGLNKVKLNRKELPFGYFPTYTSTSWIRDVSLTFIGAEGMMIVIDESFRNDNRVLCCDVSWISKFPDECEVLVARSTTLASDYSHFCMSVMDQQDGIQTSWLRRSDHGSMKFCTNYWNSKKYIEQERQSEKWNVVCNKCSSSMLRTIAHKAYKSDRNSTIRCDGCQKKVPGDKYLFHCRPKNQHRDGYDFCLNCAEKHCDKS